MATQSTVQEDFDRIALVSGEDWDHSRHYYPYLLDHVPQGCERALDIGCGTGSFTRLLAARSREVVALDFAPRMIEVARERSRGISNIDFRVADARTWEFPVRAFDCVASIATMHHLPLESMLATMRRAVRAEGALLVLDLYEPQGAVDRLVNLAAVPAHVVLKLVKTGRLRSPRPVREAWAAHAPNDVYPTLAQVREVCDRVLPGARVRRHLLWRYSVVWRASIPAGRSG
jgi:ubiquinone/menaquinone biosynthesis C-methylase UbiE